jgi:beta-glucanase (GH16 family)
MIGNRSRPGVPAAIRVACLAAGLIAVSAGMLPVSGASASTAPVAVSVSFTNATAAPGPGWTTVFSDHFNGRAGSRVDRKWVYDRGSSYTGSGCTSNWGTGEVESDRSSAANVHQDGHGHLLITPVRLRGGWTSGRIETASSKFAAPAGGQMQVTATIRQLGPRRGLGYWPAFWMLGAGFRSRGSGTSGVMNCRKWPSVGEIDVLENVNGLQDHSGTLHCGTAPGGPCNEFTGLTSGLRPCPRCQAGYHTYSVIIDRTHPGHESITWYLDGSAYLTVTEDQVGIAAWKAAVHHGFFLILDIAIGGAFPNAVCGCTTPTPRTTSGAAMSVHQVAVYVRRA